MDVIIAHYKEKLRDMGTALDTVELFTDGCPG
jgi:hypothetical protein